MRQARLIGEGLSYYHCMSRVVDGNFIFKREEKEHFVDLMRKLERFCGVRIVTYCVMSNHFHLLVEVPDKRDFVLEEDELLERVRVLSGPLAERELREEIARNRKRRHTKRIDEILENYAARMCDLSRFLKDLKQRFTQWYNSENGRRGTLWEDRFKSVLVEGGEESLLTMAAYIDLNPVRAKMVMDPADYRWSGYGEACAGKARARKGLAVALEESKRYAEKQVTWREVGAQYRVFLYGVGEEQGIGADGEPLRRGFSREESLQEIAEGGKLTVADALRCRIRYFADGAIFGTRGFVDQVFKANRGRYGPKRETGSRKMRGALWGDLRVLRDLKENVFG